VAGLFTQLTTMLESSVLLAASAALAWGVLSVILSPCHLAGIPLIVSHIVTQSDGTRRNAGVMALLFALGMLVTLLFIGAVTSLLGRIVGDTGPVMNYVVGAFLVFFGVYLTGILPFDLFNYSINPGMKKRGLLPSFLFGLIFGLALGPCTFAFMAPMIGVTFHAARTDWLYSFALFTAFAIGHCAVIVAAGLLTESVRTFLRWNEKTATADIVKKVLGVATAGAGVYLIVIELL
jgi:cytochrome c-type biogenesis protein